MPWEGRSYGSAQRGPCTYSSLSCSLSRPLPSMVRTQSLAGSCRGLVISTSRANGRFTTMGDKT